MSTGTGIVSPWRGKVFPKQPIGDQLFYLDVPNSNDPPPGWYVFMTSVGTPTAGGRWTLTNRPASDRGDLVRPQRDGDRRS